AAASRSAAFGPHSLHAAAMTCGSRGGFMKIVANSDWKWPIPARQLLAGTAGWLTFVGGAGDFDPQGAIRHPGDLNAQISGTGQPPIWRVRSPSKAAVSRISCA